MFDDKFDVKIGQQSLDQEFMVSQNASYFINTMFGWPMLPSADLPGGGPAYPLSALGVRGRLHVDGLGHRPRRRLQRQPGRQQYGRSAIAESLRHQFPAQRRRAGDRRTAIQLPVVRHAGPGQRNRSAGPHLQDRRLVRHRQLRRPALRQHRPLARQSGERRQSRRRIGRLRLLCRRRSDDLAPRRRADRNVNVFAAPDGHAVRIATSSTSASTPA